MFQLPDVAVLLEAFANPRFRQGEYLHRSLTHMGLLLQHRDDASVEDLAKTCIALRDLYPQPEEISTEVKAGLQLLGEALLLRELSELTPSQAVHVLHCMTHWRLVNTEQQTSNAPADLSWTLARELKGKLRNAGKEKPEDLAVLAEAMFTGGIRHEELWEELVTNLEFEMHRLPASFAASAAYAASRFGHRGAKLYSNAGRRLGEEAPKMSPMDCAYAAGAFLHGPASVAEKVLRGAIGERILELGFGSFDPEALTLMLNSLSRAEPGVWGVETMASSLLQEIHSRLHELDADQLTSIVRSLGHLQPEVPEVLKQVLDHCQLKVEDAGGISPRSLARLCQGIAMQPSTTLPDASERLVSLIPQVRRALEAKPTAVSTAQIFWSYSRCSFDERDAVLKDADTRLTERAIDLTADLLLNLVEAMEAIGRTGWSPSEALVQKVSYLLDMKRYDLQPGRLWRATKAFESLGVAPELIPPLETRDQPAAAQTKRKRTKGE